ncbi:MAG TPA: alpha-amylase family glycosyl hydrolase [Paludibacteraceae bacterium]|nr:alpha-amylase family glycosyl hydrolase [Paludibacteraceae bacterium]
MKKLHLNWQLIITVFSLVLTLQSQAASFVGGRTDFRDETIYFLMTTRFYDGDLANNVQCWDGKQYNQGDPAWRGDFKGLIEKLDYIKALGFTAIWITPVVENCSGYDYHGYHAINFNKVDPRYESEDCDFQDLIDAVHAKGMKIILDVVFNHTGNFGEEFLCPMFTKTGDLSTGECLKPHANSKLPANYESLPGGQQYQARLALMKNTDGINHDNKNYWHHFGNFNWDDITSQWAQIAGDCVDLNTENPAVYNYIVRSYSAFIRMGVDGFRIDTGKHISRLVFNKVLNDAFHEAARSVGKDNFFMFSEICTRDRNYWYRNTPAISTPFYTWKDSKSYAWSEDESVWENLVVMSGTEGFTGTVNQASCISNYNDNSSEGGQPSSTNAKLNGNDYHTPDWSMHSGLNVIDFPMHWNFENASSAYNVALGGDWSYNDATFNVTYVDSHDYAPDGAPEGQRFAKDQSTWAENLTLMYTFRGIPCVYYGSEIEFKKGSIIDKGPNMPLRESGRAYYGDYITGAANVTDFGEYTNATGNMAVTLKHPLALHIQRLSKLRMAIPALRKGQYSTDNCSGSFAFKRRYTDATTDSYVLVCISGGATFSNIPNGTYVDAVTGDTKNVTTGSLTASCSGKGNLRAYVLSTAKTAAPGKVGTDGKYVYSNSSVVIDPGTYPDATEILLDDEGSGEGGGSTVDPITPCIAAGERAVFFTKSSEFGSSINVYIWHKTTGSETKVCGAWPGKKMTALGNNTFKYTIPEEATAVDGTWKIIFNDGGNQTKDLAFTLNGLYTGADKNNISSTTTITLVCTDVAIDNVLTEKLVIYSNHGSLYISSPEATMLEIHSIDGRLLRTMDIESGITTIDGFQQGVYLVNGKKVVVL